MAATGFVTGTPGARLEKYCGALVTTAIAGATVLIRNGAGGTVVGAFAAAAAAGAALEPSTPVQCDRGVYFDLNGGSGTVTVFVDI